MANSLVPQFSATYQYGTFQDNIPSLNYTYTPGAAGLYSELWTVTTTEVSISSFPGIATLGPCYLFNTDPTNYVDVGVTTGVYFARIPAGQFAYLPLEPGITLFAKAHTSSVQLLVKIYNA